MPPSIPPNISQITGSSYLGILFNWGLFGVLSTQLYIYRLTSGTLDDTRRMQILVYCLYVIESIQTIMCTVDGFHWFVFGWGDLDQLSKPAGSSIDSPFLDGLIALMVQTFFCWRIFKLSKNRIYPCFLFSIALAQCFAAMYAGIRSVILNDLGRVRDVEFAACAIWLGGSALVDTLIAISTSYLLLKQGRGLPTDSVVMKIVRITIETNALTAGVAILTLMLFIFFPKTNYFLCPPYVLGKLYSNTLLFILNNRVSLHKATPSVITGILSDSATRSGSHCHFKKSNNHDHKYPEILSSSAIYPPCQPSDSRGVTITVHQSTREDAFSMKDLSGSTTSRDADTRSSELQEGTRDIQQASCLYADSRSNPREIE